MKKYLVIDSIARSGTTLLSSLIRSQEKCITFDGNFNEALFLYGDSGWPHLHANRDFAYSKDKKVDIDKYKKYILKVFENDRLSGGKKVEEWKKIISQGNKFDQIYDLILKDFNAELIGLRWNQSMFYSPLWLERSNNHFWLTVIRNPLDRIVSNMKTHNWNFDQCLSATQSFEKKYNELSKKYLNVKAVFYEDLIEDPKKTMSGVMSFLDIKNDKIETENLLSANYNEYRNQGWRVKDKKYSHTKGSKFSGFYSSSVGQYKKHLSNSEIDTILSSVSSDGIFGRYK